MQGDGGSFTEEDLQGTTTVLVFYPFAFSVVCTDQFQHYQPLVDELAERGAVMYGVSCDSPWAQSAFKEKLGVTIEQLRTSSPRARRARPLGCCTPAASPAGARDHGPRRQRSLELPGGLAR